MCQYLISQQKEEGYFGEIHHYEKSSILPFDNTGYAIIALSRFMGSDHDSVKKGIKWLIDTKENDYGVIQNYYSRLGLILLDLIAIGGGPKISLAEYEWRQMLQKQQIDFMKPYFIHTSPVYGSKIQVRELYETISENIKLGKEKIRICSLFIDILYEEIIELVEKKSSLEFQIITRPSKEITGMRERIARNVLHLLNTATRGNLKTNEFVHCRMIIIDENVLIVSSADLTRDQLFDEFNAGFYTRDKESIKKAISFFDNIWEQSNKLST
jgi:hypothetical protein